MTTQSNPARGGTWRRDPETGELTRTGWTEPRPAARPSGPAAPGVEASYAEQAPEGLPWSPTDAMLVSNARFRIDRDVIPRGNLRGHLGGDEHLVGTRRAEIEFDVEFTPAGGADTVPPWGILMRACGMAETVTAAEYVTYTPVSGGFESIVLRYAIDGVVYYSRGARGNVRIMMNAYEVPKLQFRFMGFDTFAAADTPNSPDFSAWERPLVVKDANTGTVQLGGALWGGAGWAGGGTELASRGLEIDLGNRLSHVKLLGGESIDIVDRETTGRTTVALSAADEVQWRTDINNHVLTGVGFNMGTVAGARITAWMPSVQRIDPQATDYEGRVMMQTELRVLPVDGNDELTLVTR